MIDRPVMKREVTRKRDADGRLNVSWLNQFQQRKEKAAKKAASKKTKVCPTCGHPK